MPIIFFIFVYFGFQIFSQIWNTSIGIPSTRNYIQNFISALVLIGLVIYFADPQIITNQYSLFFFIITFVLVLLYSYAKKGLDDMSEKDKALGKDNMLKVITILMIFAFGTLAFMYFIFYVRRFEFGEFWKPFLAGGLVIGLMIAFYFLKHKKDDKDNIVLALYLYPFLFLTKGLADSRFLSYAYIVLYTAVIALWGFFGVEWFTGKKDYEGVSEKVCKAYLGISDDDLSTPIGQQGQTKINTRNINFIYIAIGLIFCSFVLAVIFMYISFQKLR